MMSEYWIISAPGDKTCQQTFDTMNNLTSKQHSLCSNYKFHIPDLKVGTLDQLVGLSDDLGKLDTYVEQITRKVAMYLGEVLEDQRDKLHENLQANNSPGPPDEIIPCRHHNRLKHLSLRHQRKHQHTHHQNNPLHYQTQHHHQLPADLKGKCYNSTKPTATTLTTSCNTSYNTHAASASASASACAYASIYATPARASCNVCHLSGGSLTNLSSTHDESERDFDFVIPPAICGCDECYALSSSCSVLSPPSASATTSTLMADECYSQTASSMLNATRCAINTVTAIATGSSMGTAATAATANAAGAPATTPTTSATTAAVAGIKTDGASSSTLCSSAYFSTSAPTASTASSSHSMSRSNSKKLNNNTCSINNNKLSFRSSSSHISQLPQQQQPQQQSPKQHLQQLQLQQQQQQQQSPPLLSPTDKSYCDTDEDVELDDPKSPQSASSLSETFDWWFNKPKRNSKKCSAKLQPQTQIQIQSQTQTQTKTLTNPKPMTFWHQTSPTPRSSYRSFFNSLADQIYSKRSTPSQLNINNGFNLTPTHRSSPVSSCCGSSSQGRSSPDTDLAEPPEFPLSPADLPQYLTRFQWDMAKYPIKQSLRNIADIISKQIGQIDGDLKTKSQAYNNLKGNLQNLEKKKTGSLLTRNLADLVKKEHFILDSEYLTTVLVIVPKASANDWLANYEKITDMIVPRSSQLIKEDPDYCLFNVTLFKKVTEEFKLHARERKFIVRDFVYNEEELAAGKNEMTKLMTDKKKQFGPLVRWLKVNFSEAFCALIHVKALRVFVESVLRYGLPVNFQAILIEPNKKSVKRLRDVLNQLYGHLDGASAGGHVSSAADNVDIPGLGFGQSEYFPYVFYKVNIDMVEQTKL
ncbi:V-type proton ATPase subunit C isoform X2 [Drosophila grimshawi]|uniref:V-type proton ATPase subunit C isoform X2 n=1 Tax=Drosophila grimshawi TaxID=7222 RepID=UPI000C86F1B1|nr:V-type proton ATPase subunit C isoform X2 [Drosophila grimshawi]